MTVYIEALYQTFYLAEIAFFYFFFRILYVSTFHLHEKIFLFSYLIQLSLYMCIFFFLIFFVFCFDLLDSGWIAGFAHWDIAQEV